MRKIHKHSNPAAREAIVFPIRPLGYVSYAPIYDIEPAAVRIAAKRNRKFVPYQENDVIFINVGSISTPVIKLARILGVHWYHMHHQGMLVPKWQIQLATGDGYWSKLFQYCYPGDVYRAYYDHEELPRKLPRIVRTVTVWR